MFCTFANFRYTNYSLCQYCDETLVILLMDKFYFKIFCFTVGINDYVNCATVGILHSPCRHK